MPAEAMLGPKPRPLSSPLVAGVPQSLELSPGSSLRHTFTHYTFTMTGEEMLSRQALGIHIAEPSSHGRAVWCLETPNGHLLQHPDENTIHVNWGGEHLRTLHLRKSR